MTINAGTSNGIRVGQDFFVRRTQTDRDYEISGVVPDDRPHRRLGAGVGC